MTLPATLPTGTRYIGPGGVEYELLGPSTMRANGTYPVPARRYSGVVSEAPVDAIAPCLSLDIRGAVTLPEAKLDPYAEHRKKIGHDK